MEYGHSRTYRRSCSQMFFKIHVLKNFTIFTEKHVSEQSESLFDKVAGLQFFQKETPTQVFSCEYCEIFKDSFFNRTPLIAASGFLTKPAENKCEENHFSVEFFSEVS